MSRITDAILSGAYSESNEGPVLNLEHGGQHGFAPNLGFDESGTMKAEWIGNQAYVSRNVICILLEAPKFFNGLKDSSKWVKALKSLMELHTMTIEGLNAGLTVEVAEHALGGGGEMQEEFTDVKRARSTPTHGIMEKKGLPVYNFLNHWITYGMMDPETKTALMYSDSGFDNVKDQLADQYTMSCLYVELDPTHKKVMKAWVCSNMMPKGTGELVGKKDLNAAGETNIVSVEFTAITQYNLGTIKFAQSIIDKMSILNANPYLRKSFVNTVDTNVDAASDNGYRENIDKLAAEV